MGEQVEVGFRGGADNASAEVRVERSRHWCDACTFLFTVVKLREAEIGASLEGKNRNTVDSLEELHQNPIFWHHS